MKLKIFTTGIICLVLLSASSVFADTGNNQNTDNADAADSHDAAKPVSETAGTQIEETPTDKKPEEDSSAQVESGLIAPADISHENEKTAEASAGEKKHSGTDLTAEEIIDRMEKNQTHDTGIYDGEMIISDRFGERRSSFRVYARGTEKILIEFTSREEAGQKVLRTENEIYLYYPDAAEIIRLQGAALRDSMLGSDVSYEDMTGGRGLRDSYTFNLLGTESVDNKDCYKIEMNAKTRNVAYPRQIIWVDREFFVLRQSHQFALSGRLLKETKILETAEISGMVFPVRYKITDKMKRSSGTEFRLIDPKINVELPADIFSLEELTW